MKKWMLISAIAIAAISGCSESDDANKTTEANVISIDPFVPKMQKGSDATTSALASGINIYAYQTGVTPSATPFLNGVKFTKTDIYWSSTPTSYWPDYALNFFGFYPVNLKPSDPTNPTTFTYTVAADAVDEYDVVTGYAGNLNREIVQMDYHHALSKISFIISTVANSGLNITVNTISVENIPMSGEFVLDTTATQVPDYFTVSNQAPVNPSTGVATVTQTTPINVTASTENVSSPLISGLYLIPHSLVNWAYDQTDAYPMTGTYININGALSGLTDYTGDIAIPITTTQWQPGYHYIYTIVFGNTSGTTGGGGYNPNQGSNGNTKPQQILMPIQINVTVDTWTDITIPSVDL